MNTHTDTALTDNLNFSRELQSAFREIERDAFLMRTATWFLSIGLTLVFVVTALIKYDFLAASLY